MGLFDEQQFVASEHPVLIKFQSVVWVSYLLHLVGVLAPRGLSHPRLEPEGAADIYTVVAAPGLAQVPQVIRQF